MTGSEPLADRGGDPVAGFIEALEDGMDTPGVGAVAGVVVVLAAGLTEAAARSSSDWEDAGGVSAQARALKGRAGTLAARNASAHSDARGALRESSGRGPDSAPPDSDFKLGIALDLAAELPLEIAAVAADAAELALLVAEQGADEVRPDAAGAAALAAAASAAAVHLVEINLATLPDDERLLRGRELQAEATAASERALGRDEAGAG